MEPKRGRARQCSVFLIDINNPKRYAVLRGGGFVNSARGSIGKAGPDRARRAQDSFFRPLFFNTVSKHATQNVLKIYRVSHTKSTQDLLGRGFWTDRKYSFFTFWLLKIKAFFNSRWGKTNKNAQRDVAQRTLKNTCLNDPLFRDVQFHTGKQGIPENQARIGKKGPAQDSAQDKTSRAKLKFLSFRRPPHAHVHKAILGARMASPPTAQGHLWCVFLPGPRPERSFGSKWARLWHTFPEQRATISGQKRCHYEASISGPFSGPKKGRQSE